MDVDDRHLQRTLIRFVLLSLAAAVATIILKLIAASITGSVGLLSDAMESGVNLVAALVALWALRLAARPPDAVHQFGHGKAEYISAAVEGGMVFVAATVIVVTSVRRLVDPAPLESAGLGLAVSTLASGINLAVGLALLRAGRRHRSLTLEAGGKHLLTDVVTLGGVLVGVALVAIFNLELLDPIVALLVGVNIVFTGYQLVRRSLSGILDAALPAGDIAEIEAVLDRYRTEGVDFHALRHANPVDNASSTSTCSSPTTGPSSTDTTSPNVQGRPRRVAPRCHHLRPRRTPRRSCLLRPPTTAPTRPTTRPPE